VAEYHKLLHDSLIHNRRKQDTGRQHDGERRAASRRMADTDGATSRFISGLDHIEAIGGGMLRFVLYMNIANEAGILESIPWTSIS
jgi:hypothetical protein